MPPRYQWNFTCSVWKLHRKSVFTQWQTREWTEQVCYGTLLHLGQLKVQSLTNLNICRAGVARFRNAFDQILTPHLGKAPWEQWEEHSKARGFPWCSTTLAEPRAGSGTNSGNIWGVRRQRKQSKAQEERRAQLSRSWSLREPVLPLCWADTTSLSHTHICGIGQLSWAESQQQDEGCLQQDLLLWKALAFQGKSRPVVMQSVSGTIGQQSGAPKRITSFTI